MKLAENVLAVIGLVVVVALAVFGVLNLVPKQSYPLEPRMSRPVNWDATMCQRGAGERWKCRTYSRSDR